jgi:hypothetical protein
MTFWDRVSMGWRTNRLLIIILLISAVVWAFVYGSAAQDFLSDGTQPFRGVWNGYGELNLFGYTVQYEFEGYIDYDYYYQSWSQNILNGLVPYSSSFDTIVIGGHEFDTPYFLPPLFVYLCAAGALLPLPSIGLGLLITLLGYLTSLPICGIASRLSMNNTVGALSAGTYLLNPLVLYHTAFQWLNPAPFVFFMMLSFYLLMDGRQTSGLIAMVTAALFKQIAFFLALPLIAYFIKKAPSRDGVEGVRDEKGRLISDSVDLRRFLKAVAVALIYAGAVSLPFLLDPGNYLNYILNRPGAVLYDDVTTLPSAEKPITFTVLLILIGAPEWLAQFFNVAIFYTLFLLVGLCSLLLLMLLVKKDDRDLNNYWRRLLFLTLLLLLWFHLFSPRGIYKYYLVALAPFFSIFSTSRMIGPSSEPTRPALFTVLSPALLSLALLIPSRYTYLAILLVILLGYVFYKQFSIVHGMARDGLARLSLALRGGRPDLTAEGVSIQTSVARVPSPSSPSSS